MENAKVNNGLMEVHSMDKATRNTSSVHIEFVTEILNASPAKLRKLAASQSVIEILGEDKAKELGAILRTIADEKENAAASAANTDNGKPENGIAPNFSAPHTNKKNGENQYEKF